MDKNRVTSRPAALTRILVSSNSISFSETVEQERRRGLTVLTATTGTVITASSKTIQTTGDFGITVAVCNTLIFCLQKQRFSS